MGRRIFCPKGPCGTTFWQKTIPLRSAHTRRPAYTLRLYLFLHQSLETQHCRPYLIEIPGGGARDPKGTQGDQMGPKGGARGPQRAPSAPFGGMGPWGPLGLFRSHSEWSVIPKPVRRPFRTDGPSEWKVIPCVHTVAKMPNRFKWI